MLTYVKYAVPAFILLISINIIAETNLSDAIMAPVYTMTGSIKSIVTNETGQSEEKSIDVLLKETKTDLSLTNLSGAYDNTNTLEQYQRTMMSTMKSMTPAVLSIYQDTGIIANITGTTDPRIESNIYITLRECIAMGLEENLGLTIARYNPALEWEGIRLERSVFDPQFYGIYQWSGSKTPRPYEKYFITGDRNIVVGNQTRYSSGFEGNISGKFITGLKYSIGMGQEKNYLDPGGVDGWKAQYGTTVAGSLEIPLLKNFGIGVNLAPMRIQRNNWRISKEQLNDDVQNLTTDIINYYWTLYFIREDASAKEYTLRLALELLKINTAKVKVGMAAPIEITQAKAKIALQEEQLIVAQNNILNAEDRLRQIINYNMHDLLRPKALRPIEYHLVPAEKPDVVDISFDEVKCIDQAIKYRQSLQIAGLKYRNANESMKIAKNNLLPEVNVRGGLGYDGLGGNYGNAYDDQYTGRHPDWSVGLEVSFPIFYNEPVATYRRAKYNKDQAKISVKQEKQNIAVEVRTALRNVIADRKRIQATQEGTKEAQETLRAEQEKFNVGQSTTFLVLQYQDDLATALSSEIRSLADWRISLSELYRVTAQTLPAQNIAIDEFYQIPNQTDKGITGWIWSEGPRK
ncbi:TolC family protein [bacterium]|nr:TolC family protein [bacterium]